MVKTIPFFVHTPVSDVAVKAMLQIWDIMLKFEKLKTSAKNNREKDFESPISITPMMHLSKASIRIRTSCLYSLETVR